MNSLRYISRNINSFSPINSRLLSGLFIKSGQSMVFGKSRFYYWGAQFTTTIKIPHRSLLGRSSVHTSGIVHAVLSTIYSLLPFPAHGICRKGRRVIISNFPINSSNNHFHCESTFYPQTISQWSVNLIFYKTFLTHNNYNPVKEIFSVLVHKIIYMRQHD